MTSLLRKCNTLCNQLLKGCTSNVSVMPRRWLNDMEKSTMTVVNEDTSVGLLINSYSRAGFRLSNGMMAIGPIAIFPKSVLSWNVNTAEDINEDSLSLFYTLEPKIDILVIGVGNPGQQVSPKIIQYMKEKHISLEISPTETACATYNFLNAEGRCVAGALIPPTQYRINEDDIASTKRRNRELMKVKDYEIV
ncbi:NADH dehydrogenase [ubiquinone] 1 alpha subcomplex assembly factor 3-like isoform X1 [Daphnia carinata]|uniref:NADH dehydrogenase [ubiquinone] 1 alpha subcomplex assembly factor 3-like isoform X1 n=2 Tax=Daphnia carinata TaxID=120202 RepID=UPI00257AFE78|nr:NADH dehydrogenase [ubiquinone] 1 alpha subcomplex assembly factor 3-like isoform X1 [Daphnia carinata]XP_059353601.1 NADH dehydrogenase [ubiquinone] 1 alpha subcomplex assembly factor 3-like isoform X1 [Daphnia carinata]